MAQPRNAPCECGSGKKYKYCHGGPGAKDIPSTRKFLGSVLAAALAGLLVWSGLAIAQSIANGELTPADGRVWSAEHGHWHDANGQEIGSAIPIGRPPTPGAIWSAEHGHWHDENGQELKGLTPGPNDPAPPGKVWSDEHQHWH